MRMYDLIRKKRDGERLAKEEIDWMIRSYTYGEIPDYQMSALMMAIYFRGMNEQETLNLTLAMADSGCSRFGIGLRSVIHIMGEVYTRSGAPWPKGVIRKNPMDQEV